MSVPSDKSLIFYNDHAKICKPYVNDIYLAKFNSRLLNYFLQDGGGTAVAFNAFAFQVTLAGEISSGGGYHRHQRDSRSVCLMNDEA